MRSSFSRLTIAICCAGLLSPATQAQQLPSDSCVEPTLPPNMNRAPVANAFYRTATAYQKCLMEFADEQKALADTHSKAANAAIAKWNAFSKKHSAKQEASQQGTSGS
ncbi:MAG: hypothetical protein AAF458_15255 [Pseudomonadota bacterium]